MLADQGIAEAPVLAMPDAALDQERIRSAKLRRLLIVGVPAGALAIAGALLVAGLPEYARHVAWEKNPMTWLQSVIMALSGFVAGLLAVSLWLAGRRPWLWAVVSASFVVLALDEWFIVHERLRDEVLSGWPRVLPWAAPGEVLTIVYALGGLALTVGLLRAMRGDRAARRTFVVGMVLAVLAVGADTVDAKSFSYGTLLAEQTAEEIVELLSLSMMLLGLLLFALGSPPSSPAARPDATILKGPGAARRVGLDRE